MTTGREGTMKQREKVSPWQRAVLLLADGGMHASDLHKQCGRDVTSTIQSLVKRHLVIVTRDGFVHTLPAGASAAQAGSDVR